MGLIDIFSNLFSRSGKTGKGGGKGAASTTGGAKNGTRPTPVPKGTMVKLDDNAGKKRKKAERVSAAPVDEEALGFSISIKKDDELSKKRHAIRIRLKGLEVHIHRLKKRFPVMDISATGLGFAFEKPRFKGGVELAMDLILNGEVKAQNVLCKVMRHERGTVGCTYVDLDRAQDDTIHALVLLGQKQQAERKSRKKDEAFNLPD